MGPDDSSHRIPSNSASTSILGSYNADGKSVLDEEVNMQIEKYSAQRQYALRDLADAVVEVSGGTSLRAVRSQPPERRGLPQICFVSSFPPRECGIATFTEALIDEIDKLGMFQGSVVIPVTESATSYPYGTRVKFEIERQSLETYERAADYVNNSGIALSNLQHEFGLFGGDWGEYILRYLEELEVPSVVTLHTVLMNSKRKVREVVAAIAGTSLRVIVMTRRSRKILLEQYGVSARKVRIIPHGTPKVSMVISAGAKASLYLTGRFVLSTFGLIHRGKGIEYTIKSLPKIVEKEPSVLYLVLGRTHPEVWKREGESYRNELMSLVERLGMGDHVRFHDGYLTKRTLETYLQATDIYLAPYLDENQSSSGTLSYAMGFGKPVIATPFSHAIEAVSGGRGVLCNFKDPASLADATIKLLDPRRRAVMGRRASRYAASKDWTATAIKYAKLFKRCIRQA